MVEDEVLPDLPLKLIVKCQRTTLPESLQELTEARFVEVLLLVGLAAGIGIKIGRKVQGNSCVQVGLLIALVDA